MDQSEWLKVKKWLVVRLDSMGDVLMTTPAIRAIKETVGGSEITLLTSSSGAAVAAYIPEVDEVIEWGAPWVSGTGKKTETIPHIRQRIEQGHFEAAIIFTVYSQSAMPAALMLYESGVPLRIAYGHENPYELLTHWVPDPEPNTIVRHEVERQLALVGRLGFHTAEKRLSFKVAAEDRKKVRARLVALGVDEGGWWILHPGSREERRSYPIDRYAVAVAMIASNWPGKIVITGTEQEAELAETLLKINRERVVNLTGALTLGELGALIEAAPLLVTNNTGPAHLSAAVGTPVVDLYAKTNLQHTPWHVPAKVLYFDVPCKQCERGVCPLLQHDAKVEVKPEQVYQAVMGYLEERSVYA
jgi:ADP-heptose:LPS heptosyltransferase